MSHRLRVAGYEFPCEIVPQCHCEEVERPKQSNEVLKKGDGHARFGRSRLKDDV
jgi:hypothetical protein